MEVGGCSTSRPLSFSVTQSKSKSKSKSKRTMLHFWCPKPIPSVPHMALGNNHHQHTPLRMSSGSRSDTTDVVGSYEVVWSVEADLGDGQLLYLTGDPVALGCWDPDMALLMFPTQHLHLWNLQLKVPCGIHFKYSYFIKHPNSNLLVWRPGPQSSLLIPPSLQNQNAIHVRDMWTTLPIHTLPPHHFWGSWFDIHTPPSFITDQHALSTINNNLSMHQNSHGMDDTLSFTKTKGLDSSETDQPVEEPWLPLSLLKPNQNLVSDHYQLTPKESPPTSYHAKGDIEDQSCLSHLKDPISTIILISSSVCTMQRIAILEDEKLVELLLEPVKNNVQCDNVYLGVITKLIPNMGGAFVNIGISRPSLMQIKHYREPFVFPPFRRKSKQKDVKPSAITDHKGHPDTTGNKLSLHNGVDVADGFEEVLFQCDSEQFANEDFEDHDVEYDFDSPTAPETNMNGHYLGSTVDDKFFSAETGGFRDSQLLHNVLQDMKDSESVQSKENKWDYVQKGTKVIVQVVKEGLGTKGPTLTAYPHLRSRFWILSTRCKRIGVSKKISGVERTRLRVIAKTLQPPGFGLTVRTVSAGHTLEELQKDLEGLLSAWKSIMEHAKSAALAADEGVEGAIPVILHRAMGQTLSVAQDYFNEKVKGMIVDSPRTYHEITSYLQEIAPDLCHRVKLYSKKTPIFDEYGIEEEINNMLNKRVPLANGGSLVIEQTEALVSIDVNGGHGMLGGQGNSQEKAVLEVNLAAAKQIARELRLRDIGGIIVVDFIDMVDESNKKLVYKEVKRAVEKDRSKVKVSELSRHGLMEITRKRVRPSVTFMISEPCPYCHATGRVEALETSFSKIELEICRLQAMLEQKQDAGNPKSWPKFVLRVDQYMCNYLTSGKRTRLALLSSSLKVWILLKVARGFSRGAFEVKPFIDEMENSKHNQVSISRLRPREGKSYIPSTKLALFPVKKWQTGPK